ncbi:MAG: glycoside hydrolase TIM-barrel-like domain-containing protein, partial [Pseudomonadota bacterium]
NVEGGEGYDWYYASEPDRDGQVRTLIDDPVYRYKDMRHWWSTPHVDRRGGQLTTQSPWQPRSKPIWLLEIGCPAVDKGANQPNVFNDEKSIDAALPYYSDGTRDDLIQRRYIEAFLSHYEARNEPGFLDLSRASVWAWDARPFPDFPSRTSVWSDGTNWARGHWLNGRTGLMPVADIIEEVAHTCGLEAIDISSVSGVIPGYVIDRPMSGRAVLDPLLRLFDIELAERSGTVVFAVHSDATLTISADDMLQGPVRRTRTDPEGRIRDVRLTYIDAGRDYQMGTASARQMAAESIAIADLSVPASLDEGFARYVARRELEKAHAGEDRLQFGLSMQTGLRIEIGDRFLFDDALWSVTALETGSKIDLTARRVRSDRDAWFAGFTPGRPAPIAWSGPPQLLAFDLPDRSGLAVGALLDPFEPVRAVGPKDSVDVTSPVRLGATLTPFPAHSPCFIDRESVLDILMPSLPVQSVGDEAFLAQANRFAIETHAGWEIIAARDVVLFAPNQYRLSHFL